MTLSELVKLNFESEYRNSYNNKAIKFMNIIFLAHYPIALLVSYFFKTEYSITLGLTTVAVFTSLFAAKFLRKSPLLYVIYGCNMILLSAMVIYGGRGLPEFHFHFFVGMSILLSFSHVLPILSGVVFVSVHHILTYFLLPGVGFPTDYSFILFSLHFIAAVFQAIPCLLIAFKASNIVDVQGEILLELRSSAESNQNSSSSLNSSMHEIDSNLSDQVTSLEEAAAAVVQIQSMMKQNQENIEETNKGTSHAFNLINKTKEHISSLRETMSQMANTNDSAIADLDNGAKDLDEMVKLMEQVAEKSQMINDIVFQTKLLSFNASVEAARAGEMGKGFSVVAEEVGNLAASSGSAAIEINNLVEYAQQKIKDTTASLQKKIRTLGEGSRAGIHKSVELVQEGDSYLQETYEYVDRINKSSSNIESASSELMIGVKKINDSQDVVNSKMKSTSKLIRESLTLSDSVNNNSESLLQLIEKADKYAA